MCGCNLYYPGEICDYHLKLRQALIDASHTERPAERDSEDES